MDKNDINNFMNISKGLEDNTLLSCEYLNCATYNKCGVIIIPYLDYISNKNIFVGLNESLIARKWLQNDQTYCAAHGSYEKLKEYAKIRSKLIINKDSKKSAFSLYRLGKNKNQKHATRSI